MRAKKIMAAILAAMMLCSSLTGCGGSKETKDNNGSAEQAQGSAVQTGGLEETEVQKEPEQPKETNPLHDGDKYMALTFDDGPTGNTDGLTERLLDGLKERGVHSTFFMCGYRVKDFNSMMNRYLDEGHELGNHTMDHVLAHKSSDGCYEQVKSNNELIESYTGHKPTVYRPCGGEYNDDVVASMKELGMPIILWNLDTLDWKYRDADSVRDHIVEQAKDGSIVLEHDLYETTVDGVLQAIDILQEQGYAFVTVSELAEIKGVTLEAGKVYEDFVTEDTSDETADTDSEQADSKSDDSADSSSDKGSAEDEDPGDRNSSKRDITTD